MVLAVAVVVAVAREMAAAVVVELAVVVYSYVELVPASTPVLDSKGQNIEPLPYRTPDSRGAATA